ncbi:MAG: choice-of-anchor V domain-containing protein [Acidobacteriota bacterium]|nr:choice-of-anchor V domain-containing protein [Acidobacteriota bacterium]
MTSLLVMTFLAMFFIVSLNARRDGNVIPNEGSVFGTTPCFTSACHAVGGTLNIAELASLNGLSQSFTPGTTYDMSLSITGGTVYGFQLTAVFSDNTQAGTLVPVTNGVVNRTVSGVPVLHHSPLPLNSGTINFQWTAPTNPKENKVIFKIASNSANNNFASTGDHINTLQITSSQEVELDEKLFFPQFADGSGLSSKITLVNLSTTEIVTGNIKLFADTGDPLIVDLNGQTVIGEQSLTVPAGGAAVLTTDGVGTLQAGAVTVSSDRLLAGVVLFAGDGVGVAGVGNSPAASSFIAPVEMDVPNGILTGIAIMNLESTAQTIQVELKDLTGALITTGTLGTTPLAGNGHVARYLNDPAFQFSGSPDLSVFQGVLKVTVSEGQIAGTVIRQSPGEFATLPVTKVP